MSDPLAALRWGPLPLAVALLLVLAPALRAQGVSRTELGAARERMERLGRVRDSMQQAIRARDSIADRARGWTTRRIGRLEVDLLPEQAATLEPGVERGWALVGGLYGRLAESTSVIRVRLLQDTAAGSGRGSVSIFRLGRPRAGTPFTGQRVVGSTEAESLAVGVAAAALEALGAVHDSLLAPWPPTAVPFVEPGGFRERIYVHLATSSFALARACLVGDMVACARALGLSHPVDYAAWFSPEERRRLLRGQEWGQWRRPCVVAGYLPACDSVLAQEPNSVVLPLGDLDSRASLVRTVIDMGGTDALTRVHAARGAPVAERLAAGAGAPIDSVLRRWHASILAARPLPVTVRYREGAMALVWISLLLGLALGSSRWR